VRDIINQILSELRGVWRFRWTAMSIAWAICAFGWFAVYSMPDIYRASAQVYVDADSRLAEVMGQVGVAPGVGASVFVVRQAMLGRPQLERVAQVTGLDARATNEEEYEALIVYLRESISVDTGRSSQSRNLYTISFEDSDRLMAIAVVNEILNTFVEDVLELKDKGAEEVTGYLDDQLAHYSGLLGEAEQALADFKKTNVGLLPGESGGIIERLQVEMEALELLKKDLRIEQDRRNELRRQLTSETPYLPEGTQLASGATVTGTPTETNIRDLERRRAELLLTFTERHPDVVAIDEQLVLLYEQRADEMTVMANSGGMEGAANATNPVYQSVQIAMNQASVKIAGLQSQVNQADVLVRELQSQITTIPDVEAEYALLNRNYAQYQQLYSELLIRKERERMGEAGEEREVVSFNVTDPPAADFEPIAPKRTFFLLAVLVVGLGAGGAVGFVRSVMHPVFQTVRSLRAVTGRPVLGMVSMTWQERYKAKRRLGMTNFFLVSGSLFAVFVGIVIFQEPGVEALQSVLQR
jgi:polysaccharide chain length determinant protein (PEP-CTERM system associated)